MSWVGDISLDLVLPVGCDRTLKPFQRLVVEGLVPVLIVLLSVCHSVGVGVARHLLSRRRGPRSPRDQRGPRGAQGMRTTGSASTGGIASMGVTDSTEMVASPSRAAPSPLVASVLKQLGGSLPWLLPFSYLCSTSIATQAFSAFDCATFETDERQPGRTRSYLASDLRVLCDTSDADYRTLLRTAYILIWAVSSLPFAYFFLVFKSRHATRKPPASHPQATRTPSASRFAWPWPR